MLLGALRAGLLVVVVPLLLGRRLVGIQEGLAGVLAGVGVLVWVVLVAVVVVAVAVAVRALTVVL